MTAAVQTVTGLVSDGEKLPADPAVELLTSVLTVPIREVYAVLLRAGVVKVVA